MAYPYRHPATWDAAGRIAGWLRPGGGRARIGLVVVSAAELEALIEQDSTIELNGPGPAAGIGRDGGRPVRRSGPDVTALPTERAPALLPADEAGRGGSTGAVPEKTDTAGNRKRSAAAVRPAAEPAAAKQASAPESGAGKPAAADSGGRPGNTKVGNSNGGGANARGSGPGQDFY